MRAVLQTQIDVLRKRGISWAAIDDALKISRHTAWERFLDLYPPLFILVLAGEKALFWMGLAARIANLASGSKICSFYSFLIILLLLEEANVANWPSLLMILHCFFVFCLVWF